MEIRPDFLSFFVISDGLRRDAGWMGPESGPAKQSFACEHAIDKRVVLSVIPCYDGGLN